MIERHPWRVVIGSFLFCASANWLVEAVAVYLP